MKENSLLSWRGMRHYCMHVLTPPPASGLPTWSHLLQPRETSHQHKYPGKEDKEICILVLGLHFPQPGFESPEQSCTDADGLLVRTGSQFYTQFTQGHMNYFIWVSISPSAKWQQYFRKSALRSLYKNCCIALRWAVFGRTEERKIRAKELHWGL